MVDDVVLVAHDRLRQYLRAGKGVDSKQQVGLDGQALAYIVAITSGIEDLERREGIDYRKRKQEALGNVKEE